VGIGTDITKNSRIEHILQQSFKTRFIERVLHIKEIDEFHKKTDLKSQARFLASRFFLLFYKKESFKNSKRWAYKEALVKASSRKDLIYSGIYLKKDKSGIFP